MQTAKPKYIIEITMHDCGRQFGCYGAPGNFSPNIDRMAKEGMRFNEHFSTGSVCMPSRLGILTGKYVHHTRLNFCDPNEVTLPKLLDRAGYKTIMFGKPDQSYYRCDRRLGYKAENPGPEIVGFNEERAVGADCDRIAHEICSFLEDPESQEPFFLCANFKEAHAAYWREVSQEEKDQVVFPELLPLMPDTPGSRRRFASFCKHLSAGDRAIGQILDCLQQSGKAQDTLLFFTVDHGIDFPRAKQTLYDSGIAVPLIFWGPKWARGLVVEGLSSHCDILPTICDIVGIEKPANLDGTSLLPAIKEGKTERDYVFFEKGWDNPNEPVRGVRTKRYKYIKNFRPGWPIPAVKDFIEESGIQNYLDTFAHRTRPLEELYDLENDPAELNNLAEKDDYADVLKGLADLTLKIMTENDDELLWEDSLYSRNKNNPAVRYWMKNKEGKWTLDLDQAFYVDWGPGVED